MIRIYCKKGRGVRIRANTRIYMQFPLILAGGGKCRVHIWVKADPFLALSDRASSRWLNYFTNLIPIQAKISRNLLPSLFYIPISYTRHPAPRHGHLKMTTWLHKRCRIIQIIMFPSIYFPPRTKKGHIL